MEYPFQYFQRGKTAPPVAQATSPDTEQSSVHGYLQSNRAPLMGSLIYFATPCQKRTLYIYRS